MVRVGDTVRRPARPWSASVDALLLHLEAVGFDHAPRALGYDEQGRQVLSYVPGRVDPDPGDLSLADLVDVGRVVRVFHDASSTFVAPEDAVWNVAISPDSSELICHHDLAPWNLVRGAPGFAFVDWDGAGPGSRLWDLAYAVFGFALVSARDGLSDGVVGARVTAVVDGYGLSDVDRGKLVALLAPRIRSMFDLLERGKRDGVEPWTHLWDEGHGPVWRDGADYAERRSSLWLDALREEGVGP
ncbi:MAG: phosphotransferase [Acidimicrobiales bacterium]